MEWIVVAVIGAIIGTIVGFFANSIQMPQPMAVFLGVLGSVLGGALFYVTQAPIFGSGSFYIYGALVSIGLLSGGFLAYALTSTERRI